MVFMKLLKRIFFLVFIFISLNLFALPEQKLINSSHWIYDALNDLCIESKVVSILHRAPLSIMELKFVFKKIDYEKLSISGKKQYEKIQSFFNKENLSFKTGELKLAFDIETAFEIYLKKDKDEKFFYPYQKKIAPINLPLFFSFNNFLTTQMDIAFIQNIQAQKDANVFMNIPYTTSQFDLDFPYFTYSSLGYIFNDSTIVNFKIGRYPFYYGKSHLGSIIISDYCTNEITSELKIVTDKFGYSLNVTQLNPPRDDNISPSYIYLHGLEFSPFKNLRISLLEGVLINNPFELRFLNPLMIFHGYASWNDYYGTGTHGNPAQKEASLMGVIFDYTPCKYLNFNFIYAMNQFQTYWELKYFSEAAEKIPDAFALQFCMDFNLPLNKGYVYGYAEASYTSPYMYLMEGKDWSFARIYRELNPDHQKHIEWTGSPFGPDSIIATMCAGYKIPKLFSLSAKYLFAMQGENSETSVLFSDYWPKTVSEARNWFPTGILTFTHSISIYGSYEFSEKFSICIQPIFIIKKNAKHILENNKTDFELITSLKYNFF